MTFLEYLPNEIIKIIFYVWETFVSNYRYFSCQSNCFNYKIVKVIIKMKELKLEINQEKESANFCIHLIKTWINLFDFILVDLDFAMFVFSSGIKFFFRCSSIFWQFEFTRVIWIVLCSLHYNVLIKTGGYVSIATLKYWFQCPQIVGT